MRLNKFFLIIASIALLGSAAFAYTSEWQSIPSAAGEASSANYKSRMSAGENTAGPATATILGFLAGLPQAQDTTPPLIENVRFDGREVKDNDYINYDATLTARVYDVDSDLNTNMSEVVVDGTATKFSQLGDGSSYVGETLTYKLDLEDGDHTLGINAYNLGGLSTPYQVTVKVDKGSLKTHNFLAYPNPYNPNAGKLTVGYQLSKEAPVTIFIFNSINQLVYRRDFTAGEEGARAGYNKVEWDGISNFGEQVSPGIYFMRVISEGKVTAKFKLAILK